MVSLREEFDSLSITNRNDNRKNSQLKPYSLKDQLSDDQIPIFQKNKINYKPGQPITHLTICSNMLCMVKGGNLLERINLESTESDEVSLCNGRDERVHKIFLDPHGRHLLISMNTHETLYFSVEPKKLHKKNLQKFKGHIIESVCWYGNATTSKATGSILMGTNTGSIIESHVDTQDESRLSRYRTEKYFRELYKLQIQNSPSTIISSIECFNTSKNLTRSSEQEVCVLLCAASRLYQFNGYIDINSGVSEPIFQRFFSLYFESPPRYIDLHSDECAPRILRTFYKNDIEPMFTRMPNQFSWLIPSGIYHGSISVPPTSSDILQRSVLAGAKLISFPETDSTVRNRFDIEDDSEVIDLVVTEFHVMLLYTDHVTILCTLNEKKLTDDFISSKHGPLKGIIKDPTVGTIWLYTENAVFKYKVTNEQKNVWEIYLALKKFDLAKEYCRNDYKKLDRVLISEADDCFDRKMFLESALVYASTNVSFEKVVLKFIRAAQEHALRKYVEKRMQSLKSGDITQLTLLSTWLVHMLLYAISNSSDSSKLESYQDEIRTLLSQKHLQEVFRENRQTIYSLLHQSGQIEIYIHFSLQMQDFERVIDHYIQKKNFLSALDALQKQSNNKLYYKYCPILMQQIPKQVVDCWIKLGRKIDPLQLIPSLIFEKNQASEKAHWWHAIRYLEFSISELNVTDTAVHNYLLSLHVQYQPNSVLSYLKQQGDDVSSVCYDVKYALRLCLQALTSTCEDKFTLHLSCVHLYIIMKLYEEAVAMALQVGVNEAKEVVLLQQIENEVEIKKKLWLMIAKHAVQEEKDIKKSMLLLKESQDLLKIEDILPFFPDFVTIDHFKDALCESLSEYNQGIDLLKEEMNIATESAMKIRSSIQLTKNCHLVVGSTDCCQVCGKQLTSRAFYIFPCQHGWHRDCLIAEIKTLMIDMPEKLKLLDEMQQKLLQLTQPVSNLNKEQVIERKQMRLKVIEELDDIIASDCLLCGEWAIRMLDKPIVPPKTLYQDFTEW